MYLKNIIKKLFLVSPILFILMSNGCAKENDGRVRITYQTMETLSEQRKALSNLVEEFEKEHPDIKVDVLTSTTSFQKLGIQIAGGNAPDVFYYVTDRLPGLAHKGVLLDITTYVDEIDMSQYFQKTVDSCQINGRYYMYPFHFSTDILFYNKDLFDAEGIEYPNANWTWNEFLDAAKKLTKKDKKRVMQYGTLQPRPLLVIKSFGGRCFNENLTKVEIDSKNTREALQFIIDLDDLYGVAPSAASIKDMERMDGIDMFSTGRVAMLLGRTFMLSEFRKLKKFQWDIAPVPKGAAGEYSRLAVGGNCISSYTRHPKEAWEFVKFFSGEKGSFIASVSGNCVPALKEAAYSNVFLNPPPENAILFVESIAYSESDNPGLSVWEEFYQRVIQENIDKIVCNMVSMNDGIREMTNEGNKLLKQEKEMKKK